MTENSLAAALKPFADLEMPHQEPDHWPAYGKSAGEGWPTVGDFRRAREVYRALTRAEGGKESAMTLVPTAALKWDECAGGVRSSEMGGECPKCGATDDDECRLQPSTYEGKAEPVEDLLGYLLGKRSNLHPMFGGMPTIRDLCYTVFCTAKFGKNNEDGGPCDYFNDTVPLIEKAIAKWREKIASAPPAQPAPAVEREDLRSALQIGKDAVMESFDHVKSLDDQILAEARLRDIDQALALLAQPSSEEGGKDAEWRPISSVPHRGEKIEALTKDGRICLLYANPEWAESEAVKYSHWRTVPPTASKPSAQERSDGVEAD